MPAAGFGMVRERAMAIRNAGTDARGDRLKTLYAGPSAITESQSLAPSGGDSTSVDVSGAAGEVA
jgi:hypothetical protein